MILLVGRTDTRGGIWIGDSADERRGNLTSFGITAVLNVAQDMVSTRNCMERLLVGHVGLLDGPGNHTYEYVAAILALHTMVQKKRDTLVCCHSGGRATAVVVMYLSLIEGNVIERADFLRRREWSELVSSIQSDSGLVLPNVHQAHIDAFGRIPFGILEALT